MIKVSQVAQSVQAQQVQRKGRKTETTPAKQAGDKVEISSEAKKLQDTSNLNSIAAKTVKDTPDVREDKITEIREKINEGFYDQDNIATVLADKLLKEFGI